MPYPGVSRRRSVQRWSELRFPESCRHGSAASSSVVEGRSASAPPRARRLQPVRSLSEEPTGRDSSSLPIEEPAFVVTARRLSGISAFHRFSRRRRPEKASQYRSFCRAVTSTCPSALADDGTFPASPRRGSARPGDVSRRALDLEPRAVPAAAKAVAMTRPVHQRHSGR